MTAEIMKFSGDSRQISLKKAYREGIVDSWNTLIDVGRVDFAAARTMTGYITGAVVAFRVTGDETTATLMEEAATRLLANWRVCDSLIRKLVSDLEDAAA